MSLDKAIIHKKEKRKPYTKSKAVDKTCRNHGACRYCYNNRIYKFKKPNRSAELQEKEFLSEEVDV